MWQNVGPDMPGGGIGAEAMLTLCKSARIS